jgi:enoyl-CoA hydratase
LLTREGPILTVSLNNPPMNPIAGPRHRELSTIFSDVNRDDETKVVILTGAGEVFSAGGDVEALAERHEHKNYDTWRTTMLEAADIVYSLLDCRKPIVARINGTCMGLGASVALLCDITVIVEDALIGDPHVKIGLVPGDGGALIWPQHIGFARAKEYMLLGENLTGREAADMGLVNYAVPRDQLDAKVDGFARRLAALPYPAVQGAKTVLNSVLKRNFAGLVEESLGVETWSFLSDEHRNAVFALRDRWAKRR